MNRFVKIILTAIFTSLIILSCNTVNEGVTVETGSVADSIAAQLLNEGKYAMNNNIAVLPFVESGTEESNEFSIYFTDELINSLFRQSNGELVILERTQLNQLLKEAEVAATGLISQDTAVKLGEMIGVDAVVIGTFKAIGETLRINARSVSVESGKITAVASADLSRNAYSTVLKGEPDEEVVASADIETILPGTLSVGYTDFYVDGYLNQDDDGPHGMDSEIAEIIAGNLGLDIEWVQVPMGDDFFESIVASLNAYKVDMFISVTSILPERKEWVLFSDPYTTEGDPIGIAMRKDNEALKAAVDQQIAKLKKEGTIAALISKYIDPVENIFETNNFMRAISGHYFVESCIIMGKEIPPEQLSEVDIRYSKWWEEYPLEGRRIVKMKIIDAGYGRMTGRVVEHSRNPELIGAESIHEIDMQKLEESGIWESRIFDMDTGAEIGTMTMIKGE